jgi:FkbM family methyltransferase
MPTSLKRSTRLATAILCVASLASGCGQASAPAEGPGSAAVASATPPSPGGSAAAAPAAPPTAAGSVLASKPLYSHNKEELIIRDFFGDRRDGFFLDVGCATPIDNSNTYYLERHLAWSGIGVDALPDYGPAWQKHRPRSKFFALLVSDRSDAVLSFYRADNAPDISSTRKGMKGPAGREIPLTELKVPTITLTKLLEQNGVSKVDFLSMDIEGGEPLALAGFDVDRFKPELACIEIKPDTREKIHDYFAAHGYEWLERYLPHDGVNHYFAPKRR